MKQIYMLDYIKDSIGDNYTMEVLYYTLKNAIITNDYNLRDIPFVEIDGRFHGEKIYLGTRMRYRSSLHSISMLLSVRAIMLNDEYLSCCENDHLIFTSIPKEKYQWIENATIILDCMKDDEFAMLYSLLEDLYFDEDLNDKDKERFEQSLEKPEYRNTNLYYRNIASNHQGVKDNVICNNAFVCADFSTYEVGQEIVYVGNTAFAYCQNLETIKFNGQVTFGKFPIIECEKLRQIIVPSQLVNYYRELLPYYESIINDGVINNCTEAVVKPIDIGKRNIEESEIEIVYVDIPSADPYTETEIDDNTIMLADEQNKILAPSDIKKFEEVFDKKATSYKYFWLMAIVTLAKEKGAFVIPFKDILIRMAALAWPIVFQDEINLGKIDQLSKYLKTIKERSSLTNFSKANQVETYLMSHYETHSIRKILYPLLNNVPYRFLSPWIVFISNEDVISKSRTGSFTGLYSLYDDHIVLNKKWWEYIHSHYNEISAFTLKSFFAYAKKYNDEEMFSRLKNEGWGF